MDKSLFLSEARALDDEDLILQGYYVPMKGKHFLYSPVSKEFVEINPYPVCRNTGIKDKNNKDIYEWDLIKCKNFNEEFYGYAFWSEELKRYVVRRYIRYTSYREFKGITVEKIGNIMFFDSYYSIIEEQEKAENERGTYIDSSYCPSCFKK